MSDCFIFSTHSCNKLFYKIKAFIPSYLSQEIKSDPTPAGMYALSIHRWFRLQVG